MKEVSNLEDLAADVSNAQRQVDAERNLVAKDKAVRADSLLARLVDFFTTTKPESKLKAAEARLVEVKDNARCVAVAWVIATAQHTLAGQALKAQQHQKQLEKLEKVRGRVRKLVGWYELASDAYTQLSSARSACEAASTAELLDVMSTNKSMSLYSSLQTSSASSAIQSASNAVQALMEALPKRTAPAAIDEPDDLLDLMVDMTFDLGFDVFSWLNMQKLNDSARQCGEMADKISPLLNKLNGLAEDAKAKATYEMGVLQAIEAPYLEAAAALVPAVLEITPPKFFQT